MNLQQNGKQIDGMPFVELSLRAEALDQRGA
jgi:hypothetical protein